MNAQLRGRARYCPTRLQRLKVQAWLAGATLEYWGPPVLLFILRIGMREVAFRTLEEVARELRRMG